MRRRTRPSVDLLYQLIGELRGNHFISAEEVERFRKRPNGPILPKSCVEARRIPSSLSWVSEVYLDYSSEGDRMLVMLGTDKARQVHLLRGDQDLVLGSSDLVYEVLGFIDELPVYTRRVLGTCDSALGELEAYQSKAYQLDGDFHGSQQLFGQSFTALVAKLKAAKLMEVHGRNGGRPQVVDPERSYVLYRNRLVVVLEQHNKHKQLTYMHTLLNVPSDGPSPFKDFAEPALFLHVTPPFRTEEGWRYWGTIGSHVCLMDLEER